MANQVVKLKKGSDYLYPYAKFMGIDTSNVLASNIAGPYTATQDCWAYVTQGSHATRVAIDGVQIRYISTDGIYDFYPLAKGQIISMASQSNITCTIFGIKY